MHLPPQALVGGLLILEQPTKYSNLGCHCGKRRGQRLRHSPTQCRTFIAMQRQLYELRQEVAVLQAEKALAQGKSELEEGRKKIEELRKKTEELRKENEMLQRQYPYGLKVFMEAQQKKKKGWLLWW
jgi:chromosome segregation ATPase